MEIGALTILDRSASASPSPLATFPSPQPAQARVARSSRRVRVWGISALALVGSLGALGVWLAWRGHSDPDQRWADAERAFLSGRWGQARRSLAHLKRLRSETGLDWTLQAQLDTAEGHFAQAFFALAQVPDTHPIAPQAHLLAGRLQRQLACLRKAEGEFRHALRLNPRLIEAHKELIYVLGIQSRRPEVDAEFHQLARLSQLNHHDLMTWALSHFSHWNPDIVADLDRFITADPLDRYSRLAVVELLLERPEVESYIVRILEPLPNSDPDALALRINLFFNLGRFEEAESLLAGAPSGHARISRMRGEMALRRHELDAAIRHFKDALSAEPYDRVSPMQLAQALRLKGDEPAAATYLDMVKRLNRVYTAINQMHSLKRKDQITDQAQLGKVFEEAGLHEEAKAWYALAIAADPLDGTAQEGFSRMSRLAAR
jgi:tetratricopeptide (TPR) repeat protein